MASNWKDQTANVQKVSGKVTSALSFVSELKISQYEKLGDVERRLFDKLVADRFGKSENIINNIESVANKALVIFGSVWVAVEVSSELGLINFGAFFGLIAFSLLLFSALMMLAAAIYKHVLLVRKNHILKDYKVSSNKYGHTQRIALEDKNSIALEDNNSIALEDKNSIALGRQQRKVFASIPEDEELNMIDVDRKPEDNEKKDGLLIAFESLTELQDAVTVLRGEFTSLKEAFDAQPQFSSALQYSNIRNQCKLYIDNALDLLSEDSAGVIIDSMVKTYVDQSHNEYSNFFLSMLSHAAKGSEDKSKDDQYKYLNDKNSDEFKKKAKGLLSSRSLAGFSDKKLLTLEVEYRAKVLELQDSILLLKDINICLASPEDHQDLSFYERALRDAARERCVSGSVEDYSSKNFASGAMKDEVEEKVTIPDKSFLIKTPVVDTVAVISSVAEKQYKISFPKWSAYREKRRNLELQRKASTLLQRRVPHKQRRMQDAQEKRIDSTGDQVSPKKPGNNH